MYGFTFPNVCTFFLIKKKHFFVNVYVLKASNLNIYILYYTLYILYIYVLSCT